MSKPHVSSGDSSIEVQEGHLPIAPGRYLDRNGCRWMRE